MAYTKTTFVDSPTTTTPITAAELNKIGTGIADAHTDIDAMEAVWTAFTSTWSATTTAPTLGDGTVVSAYWQVGKTVHYRIVVTFGSTTTVGSATYTWTPPVAVKEPANFLPIGTAVMRDSSASATRLAVAFYEGSGNTIRLIALDDAAVTHAAPFAWASGDTIAIVGTYEAA